MTPLRRRARRLRSASPAGARHCDRGASAPILSYPARARDGGGRPMRTRTQTTSLASGIPTIASTRTRRSGYASAVRRSDLRYVWRFTGRRAPGTCATRVFVQQPRSGCPVVRVERRRPLLDHTEFAGPRTIGRAGVGVEHAHEALVYESWRAIQQQRTRPDHGGERERRRRDDDTQRAVERLQRQTGGDTDAPAERRHPADVTPQRTASQRTRWADSRRGWMVTPVRRRREVRRSLTASGSHPEIALILTRRGETPTPAAALDADQVFWYSGPSPPSGVVRRPPLAVIAPHSRSWCS